MTARSFEPTDKTSWYFGRISRQDATDLLMSESSGGVFLVRDSSSIPGDYVLCVKEDLKICHYIINKEEDRDGTKYKIGDRYFPDLPSLLSFYKLHYLDTTPLVRPALRRIEKVVAKHDFEGNDPEDLPFRKGEILTILNKDEEQWWSAKNSNGQIGAIPVPYIKPYEEEALDGKLLHPNTNPPTLVNSTTQNSNPRLPKIESNKIQYARVKQARVPNAYDDTALRLQIGDIIRVTKTNMSGQWEGELVLEGGRIGRRGHFPFTHVDFPIDYEPKTSEDNHSTNSSLNRSPRPNDSIQVSD